MSLHYFYILKCECWKTSDGKNIYKVGQTNNLNNRKKMYMTHNPYSLTYIGIFTMDMDQIKSYKYNLKNIDNEYFEVFMESLGRSEEHYRNGGGTEFWISEDIIKLVEIHLTKLGITFEFSNKDIYDGKSECIKDSSCDEEDDSEYISMDDIRKLYGLEPKKKVKAIGGAGTGGTAIETVEYDIKQKFKDVFLGGKEFREMQERLFDNVSTILKDKFELKGIVQWPTGCGKTIGILILFVLSHHYFKQKNPDKQYKGLLICPLTDIIDTLYDKTIKHISNFGLTILRGDDGELKKLKYPTNDFILVTTHASLVLDDCKSFEDLGSFEHLHYDEVHHITAKMFHTNLMKNIDKYKLLTGTSATPYTSSNEQRLKFKSLFGTPTSILDQCDFEEAIEKQWIARPIFELCALGNNLPKSVLESVSNAINSRIEKGKWKNKKVILYVPTIELMKLVYEHAISTTWKIYLANDIDHYKDTSLDFVNAKVDGQTHLLIACEKFREGSDVDGVEMTAVWMGHTISAYILLQIIGRAIRFDTLYPEKEGLCLIIRTKENEYEKSEDIMSKILLDVIDILGEPETKTPEGFRKKFKAIIQSMKIDNKTLSEKETIEHVQNFYLRRIGLERERDLMRTLTIKQFIKHLEHGLNIYNMSYTDLSKYFEEYNIILPGSFSNIWKKSIYDVCNTYNSSNKSSSDFIKIYGKYPVKLIDIFKSEKISNHFTLQKKTNILSEKYKDIPLIPTDIWNDFWELYESS